MQAVGVTRSRSGLLADISLLAVVFTLALTFATFAVYATLLILLSLPFVLLDGPQGIGWSGWPGYMPGTF